jgi:hypothetical protein
MQRLPEDLSPLDRRACRKRIGSLLVLYGVLIIVTIRIAVGGQLSTNLAKEPAVAASECLPAHVSAAPMRQPPDLPSRRVELRS